MRNMYQNAPLMIYEDRVDLLNMVASIISEVDEADDIRATINGLRSYYQQKKHDCEEEVRKVYGRFPEKEAKE